MENKYFKQKYTEISQTVSEEIKTLDKYFEDYFVSQKNEDKKNQILPILNEFLSKKGKRIRSLLIFLTTKAMNKEITGCHYKLALCDELIHNATLIHDDIIDCSLYRRGFKTLNFDYDSKLAVLAGDYLLCEVLKTLASYNDERIRKIHSSTLSEMIKGELHQYFNRFKISTINEYIEKSKNKTAKLFEAGILSSAYLNNCSEEEIQHLSNFAINFGIAFQIQNDLDNFNNQEKVNEDIENGDYSAPVIFCALEKYGENVSSLNNVKQMLKQLKNTDAIEKTKSLVKFYIDSAIENISFLEDNLYKRALIDLCNLFKEKQDG